MRPGRLLAGFLAGLATGFLLVLLNPLAYLARLAPLPAAESLAVTYRAEHSRGFQPVLRRFLGWGTDADRRALTDPALRHVNANLMVLPGGPEGEAGLGLRVSALDPGNSIWRGRLATRDWWLLGWPGQGSAAGAGYSNYWLLLRDTAWAGLRGKGQEGLAGAYPLSARSPGRPAPELRGLRGGLAGQDIELREVLEPDPREVSRRVIQLRLPAPPQPAP